MRLFCILIATLLACGPAAAHRLVLNDGTHNGADSALALDDPDVSLLVLQDITPEHPQLWLKFDRKAGEPIDFQLGIPAIAGEEMFRPAIAVLGPGLPMPGDLPFEVPQNSGGRVFDSEEATPEPFYEPFTGTNSLILLKEKAVAEADGTHYIVLYHPNGEYGKAWVAPGTREEFGLRDILTFPETVQAVREFHQVADQPAPLRVRAFVIVARVLRGLLSIFGVGL